MAIKDNKYRGLQRYPDGEWGVDCRIRGQRYRHKCGTLTEAREYYAELKRRARLGDVLPIDDPPALKTLGEWLEVYQELLGPKTRKNQPDLVHVKAWKAAFGHMLPDQLKPDHLLEWVRRHPEHSPGYKKRQLSVLVRAFSLAIEASETDRHPFSSWARLGLPKKLNNQRDKYLTLEQEAHFFHELGPRWCGYAEFSILTGLRWGDQFGLRRQDVDLPRGFVMVQQSKHGERQPVILSGRARELLEKLLASHESEWVFCSAKGKRMHPDNFRYRVWRPALERAGLAEFRWHDLRHTAASKLVEAGEDLYTVQHVLGQKDYRSTQRYAHLGAEKMRRAMEKLASNTGPTGGEERTENGRPGKATIRKTQRVKG